MAGAIPDLVIPVRFDVGKVPATLDGIGKAGTKAGDDVARGMRGASGGAGQLSLQIHAVQQIIQSLSGAGISVLQMMGDEFKRSGDYCKELAKNFGDLRRSMQEVATLRGVPVSTTFTLEEARRARTFSMLPEERRRAQSEFLNFAGAQIGEGKKLTDEQAQDYSSRVAVMMKSAGYAPATGMRLAGAILGQKQGPQDVDALMQEFGVAFNVLEKGQVAIGEAAPQVAELMAMGTSAVEASKLFAVASPAAPGQEGTAVQAAMRAIEDLKISGAEKQFGVTAAMTPYESVRAFGENIGERKKAILATGKNEEEAKTEIAKLLKEQGVAADIRERRGLIAGFAHMGAELGGFQTFEEIAAGTSADFEAIRRKRYEISETGREAQVGAQAAVVEAERGAPYQALTLERQKAGVAVKGAQVIEQPQGWLDMLTTFAQQHFWRQGDLQQQTESRVVSQNLLQGLESYRQGRQFLAEPVSAGAPVTREQALRTGANLGLSPSEQFLAKCANELERLRVVAESAKAQPQQPLVAPPAQVAGRMP